MLNPTKGDLRRLEQENQRYGCELQRMPQEFVDSVAMRPGALRPIAAFRSRDYLVQVYPGEENFTARLSVNRTHWDLRKKRWSDDISWDELQRIKNECGFSDMDAVEVYPVEGDTVNVSNMRHLWVMKKPLPFAWRRKRDA